MEGNRSIKILRTTIVTIIMLTLLISIGATLSTFMVLGINTVKAGSVTLSITAPPSGQAGKEIAVTVKLLGTHYQVPIYIYLNGTLLTKVFGNYSGKILLPANLLPGTYNLSAIAVNTSIVGGTTINKTVVATASKLIQISGVPEPYKVSVECFTIQSNKSYQFFDFRIMVSSSSGLVDPVVYKVLLVLPNGTIKDVSLSSSLLPYFRKISTGIYEFRLNPTLINASLYGPYTLVFNATDSYGRQSIGSCTVTYNGVLDSIMVAIEEYVNRSVGYAIDNITKVIVTQTGYVIANITSVNNTLKTVNATLVTKLDNIADQVSYLTNLVKLVNSSIISNLTSVNNTLIQIYNDLSSQLLRTNTSLSSLILSANNTIIATLRDVNGSLYNVVLLANESLSDLINGSALEIITNLTSVYNNLSALLANYNASISNLIALSKNDIVAEIKLANATIITEIDAINSSLSDLILATKSDIIDTIMNTYNDLLQQMAAYNTSVTWYIGNSTSKIITTVNTAKADIINEIHVAKHSLSSQIDTVYNDLNSALNQGFSSVSTEISNAQNKILSTLDNYYTNILEKMTNYYSLTTKVIVDTGGSIKAYIARNISGVTNLIKVTSGHFDQVIVNNVTYLRKYINDEFKSQNIQLTSMAQSIASQIISVNRSLSHKISASLSNVLQEIGNSRDTITGMLIKVNDSIIGVIGTSKEKIIMNITELDKSLADKIKSGIMRSIAGNQTEALKVITSKLDEVSGKLSGELTDTKNTLSNKIDIVHNYVKGTLAKEIEGDIGTTQMYTILAIALSALTLISVGGLAFLVRKA